FCCVMVVSPAAWGPRMPLTLPGTRSNDRLLTAIFSPYRLLSPRTSIIRMSPLWRHVGKCPRDPFSLILRHCGLMNYLLSAGLGLAEAARPGRDGARVQADRVPGTVAAQPVPLPVHPGRSRAQHRAAGRTLDRLPRDHHGHVAITVLARVPWGQDDQPGAVLRLVFDLDSYRTVRVEAHPSPPSLRPGGQDPQVASQRTERGPGAWRSRPPRLGGDAQAGLGQDGDLRGNGHVCGQLCGQRKFLRGSPAPALNGGADGDNGQLRVVVSNNTKDRARARALRRYPGGRRD